MSSLERLQYLHDYSARWATLKPLRSITIEMNEPCHAYELVGGIFAKAMPGPSSFHSRRMKFVQLPTATQPSRSWEIEDVGFEMRDFAIDPGQDLLVLLEHETTDGLQSSNVQGVHLHIHTISANKPHPHATRPKLLYQMRHHLAGAEIQIAHDVVSIQTRLKLLIWNWRIGILLVVSPVLLRTKPPSRLLIRLS